VNLVIILSFTEGMGLQSSQQIFHWFYFISLSLHVSVIQPSSSGSTQYGKSSLTMDPLLLSHFVLLTSLYCTG
jgi:hypothetical protein